MKKISNPIDFLWEKIGRATRIMVLLTFMMMLNLNSWSTVVTQGSVIIIQEKSISLEDLIWKIKDQTGYEFIYNTKHLAKYDDLDVELEGEIDVVLSEILKGKNLSYSIKNGAYVIKKEAKITSDKSTQEKKELNGRVTDADGNVLPGVSIVVKGTTNGVATDIDGKYSILIEDKPGIVLVVSSVGMKKKEITLALRDNFDIVLYEDSESLKEVICTGYQTLSRERATGSFIQIKGEELSQRPTMNLIDKLDGKTSGVSITNGKVEIRGQSTIKGNTSPLYVVDGFPLSGSLLTVNPEDIESITILKDAAAASIWGVRASNGVIVVTTKKGKLKQGTKIEFSSSIAVDEKVDYDKMNWLNTAGEIEMDLETIDKGWNNWNTMIAKGSSLSLVEEAYAYKMGLAPDGGNWSEATYNSYLDQLAQRDATKQWEKHLFRNAIRQTYNLSISGGGEKNQLYASLVYNDNKEKEVGNSNSRTMLNIRDRFILNEKLSFFTGINTTIRKYKQNGVSPSSMKYEHAYNDLYDPYGRKIQYYEEYSRWKSQEKENIEGYFPYTFNQLDEVENSDNTTMNIDVRAQFGMNYKILDGLEIESKFQYERGFSNKDRFKSMDLPSHRIRVNNFYTEVDDEMVYQIPVGMEYKYTKGNSTSWVWRNTVSYNKTWNKHQLNLFAGGEVRKVFWEEVWDKHYGYNKQTTTFVPVNNKTYMAGIYNWEGVRRTDSFNGLQNTDAREISMFANMAYTFDDKYSFTGSFRIDQKNLFGSDPRFRYKPLWSVGAGWQLSKENFVKEIDWINRLNLRATYGVTGNASSQYSPYSKGVNSVSSWGLNIFDYLYLASPANDQLKWEETGVINLAADFALFNSKLSGSVEYYVKNSNDLLGNRDLDPTNGFANAVINYASMQNKGIEITLNTRILETSNLKWDVSLNFSHNKNKVTKIDNEIITPQYLAWYGALKKGQPLSNLYSFNYAGVSNGGEVLLYDTEGNTKSWREGVENPDELIYHGTNVAPYYGGLSTTIRYKGFDLTLNTSFKTGHKFKYYTGTGYGVKGGRMHKSWANRWKKPGDELTTRIPKLAYEGVNPYTGGYESMWDSSDGDWFWQDSQDMVHSGTYIKGKDLILGYTMPKSKLGNTPLKALRMSVQLNNPFMWVKNKHGVDPENKYSKAWTNLRGLIFSVKATF